MASPVGNIALFVFLLVISLGDFACGFSIRGVSNDDGSVTQNTPFLDGKPPGGSESIIATNNMRTLTVHTASGHAVRVEILKHARVHAARVAILEALAEEPVGWLDLCEDSVRLACGAEMIRLGRDQELLETIEGDVWTAVQLDGSYAGLLRGLRLGSLQLLFYEELQADKEMVLAAVTSDEILNSGLLLRHASSELQADEEVVFAAVQRDPDALKYASDHFRYNEKIVMTAVQKNGHALMHASEDFRNNEKMVRAAVEETGFALQQASEDMRNNADVVLAAVRQIGGALRFASELLQNDENVVLAAVRETGYALQHASKEMRNKENVVLVAVQESGNALQFASERLRDTELIVLAAVKQRATALRFASRRIRDDATVVQVAIDENPMALRHASARLRRRARVQHSAMCLRIGVAWDMNDDDFGSRAGCRHRWADVTREGDDEYNLRSSSWCVVS